MRYFGKGLVLRRAGRSETAMSDATKTTREPKPCEVCGKPTTSKWGVCHKTRACNAERRRRCAGCKAKPPDRPCEVCGSATSSVFNVCKRSRECASEYERRRRRRRGHMRPTPPPCDVCGKPTASKYGVCSRTAECARERCRRYREANPDKCAAANRRWYERASESILLKKLVRNRQWMRRYWQDNRERLLDFQRRRYRQQTRSRNASEFAALQSIILERLEHAS